MITYDYAITGVAGLIGSHLAKSLLQQGYRVIGFDSLIGGYHSNLPVHTNFKFHKVDITSFMAFSDLLVNKSIKAVIHCAALAHEGLSVFSPNTITNSIFSGTISVASATIQAKIPLFINTSSMARYGAADQPPFKETTTPTPIDPYGLAKLQAEQQLNLLSDIHGIKVIHIVPHNVCGPNQCYSDPFRNVMSIFANRILQNQPLYIYGDGQQQRSFSHVTDCVNFLIQLLANPIAADNKEVINIGPSGGTEISIDYLADLVARFFNVSANKVYLPPRPREVKEAWLDTSKLQNKFGYTNKYSTEDTIRDTISWIRQQPYRSFNYHLPLEIVNETTPKTWVDKL